jgi:hypothetical protein
MAFELISFQTTAPIKQQIITPPDVKVIHTMTTIPISGELKILLKKRQARVMNTMLIRIIPIFTDTTDCRG